MPALSRPGSRPRPVTPLAILADKLVRVSDRLDQLEGADPGLVAELREAALLAAGLDPYTSRFSTPESPALQALAERTAQEDWSRRADSGPALGLEQEMLSGHLEGQTLKLLVHATKATRVLEIGMFTGYSALAMAEALPEGGRVVACEIDDYVAALAQECFAASPAGDRISVRVGPALNTLADLAHAGETFDLVFIDADKARYVDYFHTLLGRGLLAPGALLCVDNTLMQGDPWLPGASSRNGEAISHFNYVVAADPRVEQVILPVRDGLTLIRQVGS
jgi:caffeoyl-CoA O-methyltransferase